MIGRIEALARENESLRAENEELKQTIHTLQTEYVRQNPFTDQQDTIDELEREVERLRTALRVVLAARPSLTEKGWEVVQEALGEVGREPETCVWKIDCPGAEYASPGCRAGYANIKNGVPEKCPRCGKRVEVKG